MSQHTFLAAALLGGLLAVGALPAWAADAEVMIDNFTFSPTEITVTTGTRVTWTNRDDVPHTVTDSGNPSALKSPLLDTGESFAFTFDRPGDYTYFLLPASAHAGHRGGRSSVRVSLVELCISPVDLAGFGRDAGPERRSALKN